ncbi:MAG: phospho-N-acetylmuramoyl-pentapeptide-transferase, partial [Clostridiales bacterium]|nr:phospho-N-acetylmuramoyl-pentapeptide-transferase [Clostridiales bacterium]
KNPLILALVCCMYMWSSITVIMQVVYFKITKKRIFKMSPYHHHLELKGYKESKIAVMYAVITIISGIVSIISIIMNLN